MKHQVGRAQTVLSCPENSLVMSLILLRIKPPHLIADHPADVGRRVTGGEMHHDDRGEEANAANEPVVYELEVSRLGESGLDLSVERDEDEHGGETHGAAVLEILGRNGQCEEADGVEEDRGQVRGEQVVGWMAEEVEAGADVSRSVLETAPTHTGSKKIRIFQFNCKIGMKRKMGALGSFCLYYKVN